MISKKVNLILLQIILFWKYCENSTIYNEADKIIINKCCEKFEILSDRICVNANETNTGLYKPTFPSKTYDKPLYKFLIGNPACGSIQTWSVYDYQGSADRLELLEDGKLRHYTGLDRENEKLESYGDTLDDNENKPLFYDYEQGKYCIDKGFSSNGSNQNFLFAKICVPHTSFTWTESEFLLKKVLNPIFHIISMVIFLIIAIVYFVLPTLRDLVGNIVTTICMCLLVSQGANLVRDFTQFNNHVSFMIADTILYISLLGAFFWLSSFGYYIWKKFRSRNVFLRVTDGQKYCWYSSYAWGLTFLLTSMAIFSHYFLDNAATYERRNIIEDEQDTIGWLGIAIFFAPIAFTILIDLFFQLTTYKLVNRRNVYGRIQHKLRINFIMYSLLFLVMTIAWIFLILSWLNYDGLVYTHIFVNAIQAPLVFYICILRQKHVTFLLKKTFCYNEPPSTNDWGDELSHMNYGDY